MSNLNTADFVNGNGRNHHRLHRDPPETHAETDSLPMWSNAETAAVFAAILRDCDDLTEIIGEWSDLLDAGYIDAYARQLQKDFAVTYWLDGASDVSTLPITHAAFRSLLARADWKQIAQHLAAASGQKTAR
jgi:hypothetical protein